MSYFGFVPRTSGGVSQKKVVSASGTNATVTKASPGQVYGYEFCNTSSGFRYVRLYNTTTTPTVGSTTIIRTIGIPPGGRVQFSTPHGLEFTTGITYSITGSFADADTTVVAAGDVVGSIDYF